MGDRTGISWTDSTWNPLIAINRETGKRGWFCIHKSPGCEHCYAESMNVWVGNGLEYVAKNIEHATIALSDTGQSAINWPLRAKRPRKIFVCSMTDLFGEFVSDALIDQVFATMAQAYWHTFQILTKRPDRMADYLHELYAGRMYEIARVGNMDVIAGFAAGLPNVWPGMTGVDQKNLEDGIGDLIEIQAAVKWLSLEPLLGPIDLGPWLHVYEDTNPAVGLTKTIDLDRDWGDKKSLIDWVVVGGESGTGARPMRPDWPRLIRDQCQVAGVPYFFKQWGEWLPQVDFYHCPPVGYLTAEIHDWSDQSKSFRVGKKAAGALLDGREWKEFPAMKGET